MGQASIDDIVSNQGPVAASAAPPSAASAAPAGGTAHIDDIVSNQGPVTSQSRSDEINQMAFHTPIPKPEPVAPPQDHKEELVKSIAGDRGLVSYRSAREVVGHVENLLKSPAGAYDAAKQYVQQIPETIKKAVMPEPQNLDPTQHDVKASPITPIPGVGAAAGAFTDAASLERAGAQDIAAGSKAMAPQPPPAKTLMQNPFIKKVQQAVSPTAAAQPEAQSALRTAAGASATDAGVASAKTGALPAEGVGFRTMMAQPIQKAAVAERGLYDTLNTAAETDLKDLYERQEDIQDALDDPTNVGQRKALQTEAATNQTKINWAENNVKTSLGVDAQKLLRQAKDATQQRFAMEAVENKLFNAEGVVKGNVAHGAAETLDVDNAIKQAELLDKPSKFAPRGSPTRLQQAFGVSGAKALKDSLYAAKASGQKALTTQRVLEIVGGAGTLAGTAWGILKH